MAYFATLDVFPNSWLKAKDYVQAYLFDQDIKVA